MIFDIFHSLGRVDSLPKPPTDREVFREFFGQVSLAEALGFSMVWVAESHFSSEVQKSHPKPVIPNYQGEVGLNTDSFQLACWVQQQTKKIGFGTAITNIVGGNGGPIAAADRVRMLAWANHNLAQHQPRELAIGVAAGRFPYINQPFGIVPRSPLERNIWSVMQRFIFLEALEIFLRLSHGEVLKSEDLSPHWLSLKLFPAESWEILRGLAQKEDVPLDQDRGIRYQPRWSFDPLMLVPKLDSPAASHLRFVLGSHDPLARELGLRFSNLDIFNLSFTPPKDIERTHQEMSRMIRQYQDEPPSHSKVAYTPWTRSRMPRTVLVFINNDPQKARMHAESSLKIYLEAMAGTVQLPSLQDLMSRALIGDPQEIIDQLQPGAPHGFQKEDRLMLWFEFNQSGEGEVARQMRLFAEAVMPAFL